MSQRRQGEQPPAMTKLETHRMNPLRTLGYTAAALAVTPILEYGWHHLIAHGRRADPTRETHLEHHRSAYTVMNPWEEMRENAPVVGGAILAVTAGLGLLLGARRAIAAGAGLAAGYALTTVYHAKMHERGPRTAYERWMWRFHWHHHAADARVNFGLTNPALDFVFGTAVVPDEVEVPARLAPEWLRNEGAPGIRVRAEEAHA